MSNLDCPLKLGEPKYLRSIALQARVAQNVLLCPNLPALGCRAGTKQELPRGGLVKTEAAPNRTGVWFCPAV